LLNDCVEQRIVFHVIRCSLSDCHIQLIDASRVLDFWDSLSAHSNFMILEYSRLKSCNSDASAARIASVAARGAIAYGKKVLAQRIIGEW
jgi:hypothetical protein